MKWKLLKSEYLFTDNWLTVRKDTCEREDGVIISPYYVSEYATWVTAVCVTSDNKIIMVKQYRHALGEVCIELPGGCVDDTDDSNEMAIRREIMEETGYEAGEMVYLGCISANPSTNNNLMHMFLCRDAKQVAAQSLDHNEEIEVMELEIAEVKSLIRENRIMQSMHLSCLMYALERLGELRY